MLLTARTVAPPETGRTPSRRGQATLLFGLVAIVTALAFPFAPVLQPHVTYAWTAADGAAAIPLMPYEPVELRATIGCPAARGPAGTLLLATVPPRPDPAATPLSGMDITTAAGGLRVRSGGAELGTVALPAGDCEVSVVSDPRRTTVSVDGAPVLTRDEDVRPDVAGAFSDVRAGVGLTLTADTRFQTTITPLKAALGGLCLLALLAMFVALGRVDRAAGTVPRLLPPRWWRPRAVDVVVTGLFTLWWVVGSITVDDGYISGIVRSTASNGFVGNVYRWLNSPEAPFSWFEEVLAAWSRLPGGGLGDSTLWMRVPSTLLGLACWVLLSRCAVPRLGRFAARRSTPWLAALALATWWIPNNLGLRPEPWVAVGVLGVFLAVERAIATRRVLPLTVGLLLAAVTAALTPGGLIAFMPVLAAVRPVTAVLRRRRDLHLWPMIVALVAAPAGAALLMVYDQSLAAVLEATRVRTSIGGGQAWYEEIQRYANLLTPDYFQGAIGKRAAVLFTLLAGAGVRWALRRNRAGIATGPAGRLLAGFWLGLLALTFTPTKWTQHFGDLAGIGAAVLLLGLVAFAGAPQRARGRGAVVGLAAVTVAGALVLAGYNIWPYASNWFEPALSLEPARVADVDVSVILLVAGGLLVAGLAVRSAWSTAGGRPAELPRRVPAPAWIVAVVAVAVLLLQVATQAGTTVHRRDTYTLGSDARATVRGDPCGLQRALSVETDPAAGLLPARAGSVTRAVRPVDVGGRTLPGITVAGRSTTGWYVLDPALRDAGLPVVVTTSGSARPGDELTAEFGAGDRILESRPVVTDSDTPRDVRLLAPAGADAVRLTVAASTSGPAPPALVTLPRMPRLTPMGTLLPRGSRAVLDWPVAFQFGCLAPEPLQLGAAALPEWRVGPPASDSSGDITYLAAYGGPFAAPRQLVTEQRMATYLVNDPTRDTAQLYHWIPLTPLAHPAPRVDVRVVTGWHSDGATRVATQDPVP